MTKPTIVTRFVNIQEHIVEKENRISPAAFWGSGKTKKDNAISVFNIDKELLCNEHDKIFDISDKRVFTRDDKPKAIARGDLKTEDICNIDIKGRKLKLKTSFFSKHCNIKPPSNRILNFCVCTNLSKISKLVKR